MRPPLKQILRFGLAGMVNTAVAYAVFALLLFGDVHYAIATFLGGAAGMVVGYKLASSFVFNHDSDNRVLRFSLVFVWMYLLNVGIQRLLQPVANHYLSGALATALCFLVSFSLNRHFVFAQMLSPSKEDKVYEAGYAAVQIRRSRSILRRLVRSLYLNDILKYVSGPSVDFGCGAGDLLALLPVGSIGLEINPSAVEYCLTRGLSASVFDPREDGYNFYSIHPRVFDCMIFTHVLEHLDHPDKVLNRVFESCHRLGIRRIILTVPCERGFRFDSTHRTFVDDQYMQINGLYDQGFYYTVHRKYFPVNWKWLGKIYTFHELRIVFDRRGPTQGVEALS